MVRVWIAFDIGLFILAVPVFVHNLKAYRRNVERLGSIQARWSIRYDLSLGENRFRLILLLLLIVLWVVLLSRRPGLVPWVDGLAIIVLSLAFFPRYNFIVVGSEGVLDRWIFIPWTSVRERRIVEDRGRKRLELRLAPEPGSGGAGRVKVIRVPPDVSLVLD